MGLTQVQSDGIGDGEVKGADLENSGVTAGTYGSSSAIPAITVDAKGRVTNASTNSIDSTSIANGTSNVSVANNADIVATRGGNEKFRVDATGVVMLDNNKIRIGDNADLQIYHDGSNSYVDDSGTGDLYIRSNRTRIGKYTGEDSIVVNADGDVELFNDNSKKFETKSNGVRVYGEVHSDGLDVDGNADIAGTVRINQLIVDDDGSGDPTMSVRGDDSSPWGFVVGNDTYSSNAAHGFKIYQDNAGNIHQQYRGDSEFTNFYLNAANGSLSQQVFHIDTNRQVFLKWQGNERLKTSSSGVDITGTLSGNGSGLTNTGGFKSMQVFTSTGTSTWTKPSGVNKVKVYVTGGGGGGGPTNGDDMSNGGGAGGTAIEVIDVSSVSSVTVTVGAGGTGAGNNDLTNTFGGTSSFGSYCSATGGSRFSNNWALGGLGGTATGGDININGADGIGGLIDTTGYYQAAGSGGASFWGQGGRGGIRNTTNMSHHGEAFGSGGGGGADNEGGANGAPGIVVVEEYA